MAGNRGGWGERKTAWANAVAEGQRRSAYARRCPKCGRGSALKRVRFDAYSSARVCRWPDCGYSKAVDALPAASTEGNEETTT